MSRNSLNCCLARYSFALLVLLMMWRAGDASAQVGPPPVNDQCAGAMIIPPAGPFPAFLPSPNDNLPIAGATDVGDPPLPSFPGLERTNLAHSVWFKFTPAESGLYTFSTGMDTYTAFRDSAMIIYTASGGCGPFTFYALNDDSATLRASISTNFNAGTTYYVVVFAAALTVQNQANEVLELQLRVSKPEVPANDTCAGAFVIPGSIVSTSSWLSPLFDTTRATTTATNVVAARCVTNIGTVPSRDMWFTFTPVTSGTYIFSTGADTATAAGIDGTTIDDTAIGLYTRPTGCTGVANELGCNDNGFGRSVLSATLSAGTQYHIVIWDNARDYVPGETALRLRVSPATRPTVETLAPVSMSSTGVVLSGSVNGNGLLTRFWFEWGPTPSLGSTSSVKIIFASANTFLTNTAIVGFQPNTEYHYRIGAFNALGTNHGALQTFVFLNDPPSNMRFERDIDGTYPITFQGEPGYVYVVQSSSNLVDWVNLGVATNTFFRPPTPTAYGFRHSPGAVPPPKLFFRVKLP